MPSFRGRRVCHRLMCVSLLFAFVWWLEIMLVDWSSTDDIPVVNKLPSIDNDDDDEERDQIMVEAKRRDSKPRDGSVVTQREDSSDAIIRWRAAGARLAGTPTSDRRPCTEKTNFVYVKEIKCASQTLVNVFRRFGLARRLSFVTPIGKKIYLGWPWPIDDRYYRPAKTGRFNILCEHAVFDEQLMRRLMPDDVVFITSLREPFSQFKSMFNYYSFQRILNISSANPLSEYLHRLNHYEAIYTSANVSKVRYCVPDGFHMSKNLMAYNLGFPTGYLSGHPDMSSNATYIARYLSYLDRTFYVVILVEYFHESLVLLRRLMCWNLTDVIYLRKNVGSYPYKSDNDPELVAIYRNWSAVDYQLYHHFNKTFWRRVAEMGPDFRQEVEHFDHVINDVSAFCSSMLEKKVARGSFITFHESKWNKPFKVDRNLCETLNTELLPRIQNEWDKAKPQMEQPKPDRNFC